MYDIDLVADTLVLQTPPIDGTLLTVGSLGVNAFHPAGFDIVTVGGVNYAYASFSRVGGVTELLTISLATGAATLLGTIGGGELVRGIAIAIGDLACTVPVGTAGVIFASPGTFTSGTAGPDVICGTAGVDQLSGGEGNDSLYGGAGEDWSAAAAMTFGDAGNDDLSSATTPPYGYTGTDRLVGSEGSDICSGGGDAGDQNGLCEA